MLIRQEQPSDFPAIRHLLIAAFGKADEADLVERLRCSQAYLPELTFIAVQDEWIAGFIMYTIIKIENAKTKTPSIALAPMAVLPELQKQGIGGKLIRYSLEKARLQNYGSVIVLGYEKYYPRFGFAPASKWEIRFPFPVPGKNFMALELRPDGLKNIRGTVRYDGAFQI